MAAARRRGRAIRRRRLRDRLPHVGLGCGWGTGEELPADEEFEALVKEGNETSKQVGLKFAATIARIDSQSEEFRSFTAASESATEVVAPGDTAITPKRPAAEMPSAKAPPVTKKQKKQKKQGGKKAGTEGALKFFFKPIE